MGVASAALVALFQGAASAQPAPEAKSANLNINPKRITFDRLGRTATVYLFNQGNGPGVYDIALIDRVMLPTGQIVTADDVPEDGGKSEASVAKGRMQSAHGMLIATPRRVVLQPGTGQTIRIRSGATADVAPGEYRTHLTVTAVPPPDTGVSAEEAAKAAPGALSFRLTSVLGIAIPVIVRIGAPDVAAEMADVRLVRDGATPAKGEAPKAAVTLDLVRRGRHSLFGDLEVLEPGGRAGQEPLGIVRGIGVYPEIDRRHVRIELNRAPKSGEKLRLVFVDDDTAPGKILAQSQIAQP